MGSGAYARPESSPGELVRTVLERKIIDGDLTLPVLSTVVTEVVQLTQSSDSNAAHLSELIHRDQTLAGHVLRVANSPLYLPSVPIVSLQQAISRLGYRVIGEIAIALSVKAIPFDVRGYEAEVVYLWKHAAAAGGWAREIARHMRASVESALLCGLLQNVGKPALLQLVRETSEELGETLDKLTVLEIVDDYHTTVGSRMAGAWGLPEVVATAVHFHHDPANAPKYQDETRVAALSDILAAHLLGAPMPPGRSPGITALERPHPDEPATYLATSYPGFAELGIYPEDIVQLLTRADRIRETVELFS